MKFFAFIFLFAVSSWGASPQQQFARQFQSSRIQFPSEDSPYRAKNAGRYSPVLKMFFQNILGWTPTGLGKELSPNCSSSLWAARLQNPKVSSSVLLQGAILQKYFRDCAGELETGHDGDLRNLLEMMSVKLEPENHPFMHPVVFNLPGNVKLKGLLALKGDFKKRPLIVLRLGVFSNIQEFLPERPWLMMLFDQSAFNVLVVENMSGSDFVANNSRFAFGGYDEGLQNILIAQMLKDPNEPLSRLVSSLHLFGVSLGGHGVFFASLLNELNSGKQPLYQSFMAVCPVVDLQSTMAHLTDKGGFNTLVDLWSRKRLAGVPEKMPAVENHESFGYLKKVVSEVARTYHGGLSYVSSIRLPAEMRDEPNFWKMNDFWPYYKAVKSPVMVWATHEDPVVPFEINAQRIQNKTMNLQSGNISVVDFPKGVHCTLPVPYDWKVISSLVQSYVLSHSPEFKLQQETFEMEVGEAKEASPWRMHVEPPKEKENFVKVVAENSKGGSPVQLNLPLSQFDFRFLSKDLSPSEQAMITRWANQNLNVDMIFREGKNNLKITWLVAP